MKEKGERREAQGNVIFHKKKILFTIFFSYSNY
jgi:hypothetical protein